MADQDALGTLTRLKATTAQLRQEMAKADATVAQVSGRISSQLSKVDGAFARVGQSAQAAGNIVGNALLTPQDATGITGLHKQAEAYTTVASKLKLVTSNAAEFTAAQNAVFATAQRSGQSLTATADLYPTLATSQKAQKLTGQDQTPAAPQATSGQSTGASTDQPAQSSADTIENLHKKAVATLEGKDALEAYNFAMAVQTAQAKKHMEIGSTEYEQLVKNTAAEKELAQAQMASSTVDRLSPQIKLLHDYQQQQAALNTAIGLAPDNVEVYREALVKLGNEYALNISKTTTWGKLTESAVDRIDKVFANAWNNIGTGAGSLLDDLKLGFKQTLADIAHTLTTKPLLNSIKNWLTGTDNGQGLSSVWGNLFGSAGGAGSSSGTGGLSLSNIANMASTAYNIITGVVPAAWAGYQTGGVIGAAQGIGSYYGGLANTAISTITKTISSYFGSSAASSAAGSAAAQGGAGVMLDSAGNIVDYGASQAGGSSFLGAYAGPLAILMGMYQSGKLYDAGVRYDTSAMQTSKLSQVGRALPGPAGFDRALAFASIGLADRTASKLFGGKAGAILSGSTLAMAVETYIGEKLFGGKYQTKDYGLALGVTNNQLERQQFQDQKKKGGLLSGSSKKRTLYAPLDSEYASALADTYDITEQAVIDLVSKIGVSADKGTFAGLNIAQRKLSTEGKTDEEVQKLVTDWFSYAADQMVGYLDKGVGGFGYSFQELASRIAVFTTFNSALDMVDVKMLKLSAESMELANGLVDAAGGMDTFTSNITTYYDKFFSDTEKASKSLDAVRKQFSDMNVVLPDTRDGYRAMVSAIDLTTEAGQKLFLQLTASAGAAASAYDILESRQNTYYGAFYSESENTARTVASITDEFKKANISLPSSRAGYRAMVEGIDRTTASGKKLYETLLAMSGSADTFYKVQESAATAAAETAMTAVNDAFSALQRSVTAEKDKLTEAYNRQVTSLNDMLATVQQNISDLTSVGASLDGALKALKGTSDTTVKMLRSQAQATLASALAFAQAGGSLAGFAGLTDALSTVSDINTDLFSSLEDFNRDQGRTANVVALLNGVNSSQLTVQQQTLKNLQDQLFTAKSTYDAQIKALDQDLIDAQAQIDKLNGIDNSVISVRDAINNLNAAVLAAIGANAAVKPAVPATGGSSTPAYNGTGTAGAPSGNDLNSTYQAILGRDASYNDMIYWAQQAGQHNYTQQQLADAIRADALINGEIRSYATGGLISGPGSGTSDSILARISNGEFIMNAAAVRAYGPDMLDQMNNLEISPFAATGPVLSVPTLGQADQSVTRPIVTNDRETVFEAKLDTVIDVMTQLFGSVKVDANKTRKILEKWDTDSVPVGSAK